jgi:hypothetical protein
MDYFLQHIARHLYSAYRDDLRDHCIVFPSRRSGLYFLKYLAAETDRPLWIPSVMTINELFHSLSPLRLAETEVLLLHLYKVYRRIGKTTESFDDFYFWGDMILSDFDDADKYLADTEKLFQNVADIKKIDQQFGGLTPEQAKAVQRFWTSFDPERSTIVKEKFLRIWSILGQLYTELSKTLREANIAYEGMIFRDVAGRDNLSGLPSLRWKMVHFAGFNALNECEKRLMLRLRDAGKAKFYWDYDNSYITEGGRNSAGYFMRANLRNFGNDMPPGWDYDRLSSSGNSEKAKLVIETSSDIAQVKLIPGILRSFKGLKPDNAHETAVILADESLLVPVLSSIPAETGDVNITMGFPLKQAPACVLVRQIIDLQRSLRKDKGVYAFGYEEVMQLLRNELVIGLLDDDEKKIPDEITGRNLVLVPSDRFSKLPHLSQIFRRPANPEEFSNYIREVLIMVSENKPERSASGTIPGEVLNEFIYRIMLALNRLEPVLKDPEVSMSTDTWTRLLDRVLSMQSVPFSGEPLSGIQIMGILETRTLDFRNIIMLSVNDGIMPAVTAPSSFIPFSLREAFGLPSVNHQESVYAYHFYRLLHRAENVVFVYNSNPEGMRSGEVSRFLLQIKYDGASKTEFRNLSFEIRNPVSLGEVVARTDQHIEQLRRRFSTEYGGRILSSSAINTWLSCRMKFYYQYVCGLTEPKKVITEIDPAKLGSMVHFAVRSLYGSYIGKTIDKNALTGLMRDESLLQELILRAVNEVLMRETDTFPAVNEMIAREVLKSYMLRIMETDLAAAPLRIISIEERYKFRLGFETDGVFREVDVGGNIDRVDMKDGTVRIVDYKTGTTSDNVKNIADLFEEDRDKDIDAWLQTLIYCEAYLNADPGLKVRPSVYRLKLIPGTKVSDILKIGDSKLEDYKLVRDEFLEFLQNLVSVIFGVGEPFLMTHKRQKKCGYCPFRILCRR